MDISLRVDIELPIDYRGTQLVDFDYIYNHSYTPQYSCSEENQIINNDCGKCNGFINR